MATAFDPYSPTCPSTDILCTTMDPNMDPKKRLQLNFGGLGGGAYNNDRNYTPTNERVFPTTPSTFPQTLYPSGQATNDYLGSQTQSSYSGQNASYFPTGGYQPQYSQSQSPYQQQQYQGQFQYQSQQPNLSTPQPSYQQPRQGTYSAQDPNSGLARQFSNQNLGAPPRQPSPYGRQPSPSSRLYANGQQPQQQQQGRNQQSYASNQQSQSSLLSPLSPSISNGSGQLSLAVEEPPEKSMDKYSSNIQKRAQGLHTLVQAFFTENITRARDRNIR